VYLIITASKSAIRYHAKSRFLYFSAKHREALNHLLYGIRERKGFVQLTGEVGAGKTTICRRCWSNWELLMKLRSC